MKRLCIQTEKGDLTIWKTENPIERMRGLLGRQLEPLSGFWLSPCNSIHTIGMKYPLDLVYLNNDNTVIKLVENIAPWRFSIALFANSIIEFHAGTIAKFNFQLGEKINFNK